MTMTYVPFVVITIWSFPHFGLVTRGCNKSNTTDATCGAGNANSSVAPEFTPGF